MVQLHNFLFFITSMVVPHGIAVPVLLKWFVSRDVPTGAPSSNVTIIPIPIPSFPLLVYLHSKKFICSKDGAKNGVLVRVSCPILLPDIIGRSSSKTRARNALFHFVPIFHFLLLESKGDFSYLESFYGVLHLLFFRTFFSLPQDRSAKCERAWRRIHLSTLFKELSQLMQRACYEQYILKLAIVYEGYRFASFPGFLRPDLPERYSSFP